MTDQPDPVPNPFHHEGERLAEWESTVRETYARIQPHVPPECTVADVAYAIRLGSLLDVVNESMGKPSKVVRRMAGSDLGTPLGLVLMLRGLGVDVGQEHALPKFASTLVPMVGRAEGKAPGKWRR